VVRLARSGDPSHAGIDAAYALPRRATFRSAPSARSSRRPAKGARGTTPTGPRCFRNRGPVTRRDR
jgi:hypothetical protein